MDGKSAIQAHLDEIRGELIGLSHLLHDNPEPSCEEYRARAWQTELLKKHGFSVEAPYMGLSTAFRASVKTGDGARVAFLSEYDALEHVGHACGHNVIAAAAVGAGIALAHAARMFAVPCEVIVMGTPGEEKFGGKVHLVAHGAFANVDFALMIHPSNRNLIGRMGLASLDMTVRYHGKAVHSARPEKGVNALTSVIALFNAIDALRQVWPDTARCNGIITEGGKVSNIVPDFAEARFTVRAGKKRQLEAMSRNIEDAAQRSAFLTGAEIEFLREYLYAERYPNRVMGELFKSNMEALGERMEYPDPEERVGSSDIGNVSLEIPVIHEYLAIAGPDVLGHTDAFREAARSPRADEAVLLGAKGLAMTGWDLATDAQARADARKEFAERAFPNR